MKYVNAHHNEVKYRSFSILLLIIQIQIQIMKKSKYFGKLYAYMYKVCDVV